MSNLLADVVITVDDSYHSLARPLAVAVHNLAGYALRKACTFKLVCSDVEYGGQQVPNAHVSFSAATVGSILASGPGWAVVQTAATGEFACTVSDSEYETVWFSACSVDGGEDDIATAVVVRGCVPQSITWELEG